MIQLSYSNITTMQGNVFQLIATVFPKDAPNKRVIWSSGNTNIAKVSAIGVVELNPSAKSGTVVITVMTEDGRHRDQCVITIKEKKLIALDPCDGIGVNDPRTPPIPGLNNRQIYAHEFNRAVERELSKELKLNGFNVLDVTKGETSGVPVNTRTALANTNLANLYVAIQYGKAGDVLRDSREEGSGYTTYIFPSSPDSLTNKYAQIMHRYRGGFGVVQQIEQQVDNGIKQERLPVLQQTGMSAILVEHGFMDYKSEANLMLNELFIAEVSQKYAKAICEIFGLTYMSLDTTLASRLELSQSNLTIPKERTISLVVTVFPENAANKALIWNSSNPDVATVDKFGRILGKSSGTTVITVRTADGGTREQCNVTVEEQSKRPLVAVDPGHGFQTPGKRTPHIKYLEDQGIRTLGIIQEHEFNRSVVTKLVQELEHNGIDTLDVTKGNKVVDVTLQDRTSLANNLITIQNEFNRMASIYVSVHYNAFDGILRDGTPMGFNTFRFNGSVSSNTIRLVNLFDSYRSRGTFNQNNRGIATADFYVLRHTKMPAVLTENGFMDNQTEALLMLNEQFVNEVASLHAQAICSYFEIPYISLSEKENEVFITHRDRVLG